MPMRGELRGELPTAAVRYPRVTQPRAAWLSLAAALSNQDLQCVAIFSGIGLLVELNVLLHVSDLGANLAGLMLQ